MKFFTENITEYFVHAQTVCTSPLLGGEGPGDEAREPGRQGYILMEQLEVQCKAKLPWISLFWVFGLVRFGVLKVYILYCVLANPVLCICRYLHVNLEQLSICKQLKYISFPKTLEHLPLSQKHLFCSQQIMVMAACSHELDSKSPMRNYYATNTSLIVTIPASYRHAWSVWLCAAED